MTSEATVLIDEASESGFDAEMCRLDRQLAARVEWERKAQVERESKVGLTIAAGRREAAALIARRHGYELHLDEVAEPGSVWAEFWPVTV